MTRHHATIAVLTVIPQELRAAKRYLGVTTPPIKAALGSNFWHGTVHSSRDNCQHRIVLGCIGAAGNADAAVATSEILAASKPDIAFLIGIAGGMRTKTRVGNVILADRLVSYEPAALEASGSVPRPDTFRPSHSVAQDMAAYVSDVETDRLKETFESDREAAFPGAPDVQSQAIYRDHVATGIEVKMATVGGGEKLLRNADAFIALRKIHGKIEAVEMEAIGFATSCWRANVPWMMIRGISDFGDDLKDDRFHKFAAQAAATVLVDFIKTGLAVLDAHGLPLFGVGRAKADETTERRAARLRRAVAKASPDIKAQEVDKALTAYRRHALEACDIIDLAGLPEDDRHVAMQRFVMRQLYVPLRMRPWTSTDPLSRRHLAQGYGAEMGEPGIPLEIASRASIGECLTETPRMVILGDPGGGKSTLLRWLATASLLTLNSDPDLAKLPDVASLAAQSWVPIIIRCRDLDRDCALGALDDMLRHTLRKAEMSTAEVQLLHLALRRMLLEGRAILLIDGLDEIGDMKTRAAFCRQIEVISRAYKRAAIVVTSRIVGYRELGLRLGPEFAHYTLAELTADDQEEFARRWCELTEPKERRRRVSDELVTALRSSDRIARLASNPMLLTTMSLVKRKVGSLPSRRLELYSEAVQVLLNWRSEVDTPIDKREALPQLEYVAFAMCAQGRQRFTELEIVDLLDKLRASAPHLRSVAARSSEDFLSQLERRTSILVQTGRIRERGQSVPVYEFRHLTFQEYLAALALVNGRHANPDPALPLWERVVELSARLGSSRADPRTAATGNASSWREVLRLVVAACRDGDADEILASLVESARSRSTDMMTHALALFCLADEPNVTTDTAARVLQEVVDANAAGRNQSRERELEDAQHAIGASSWADLFRQIVLASFVRGDEDQRIEIGSSYFVAGGRMVPSPQSSDSELQAWCATMVRMLSSGHEDQGCSAALDVAGHSWRYEWRGPAAPKVSLANALVDAMSMGAAAAHSAAWAICFLQSRRSDLDTKSRSAMCAHLVRALHHERCNGRALWYIGMAIERLGVRAAAQPVADKLEALDVNNEYGTSGLLGALGAVGAIEHAHGLIRWMKARRSLTRSRALAAYCRIKDDVEARRLLCVGPDSWERRGDWHDPKQPIGRSEVAAIAARTEISLDEALMQLRRVAGRVPIRIGKDPDLGT